MPAFGRLPSPDDRDLNFLMRAVLPPPTAPVPDFRYWRNARILDQGDKGICVGAAWASFLEGSPTRTKNGPVMEVIYCAACGRDIWTENDHDCEAMQFGTSVRAAVDYLRELGRIGEYRWALSVEDIRDWILARSPVVMGTWWREGMLNTDQKGVIRAIGPKVGGHAYKLHGYSSRRARLGQPEFRGSNSWGLGWGQKGLFWISGTDLAGLLADDGEACSAVEIPI